MCRLQPKLRFSQVCMQQVFLCPFPLNYHFTNSLFYLSKWIAIRINMTCLRHFKQTVESMDHPVLFIFTSLTTSLFFTDTHAYTHTFLCVYNNASLFVCKYIYTYTHAHIQNVTERCACLFFTMCFVPFRNVSQIHASHKTSAVPATTAGKEGKKHIGVCPSPCYCSVAGPLRHSAAVGARGL